MTRYVGVDVLRAVGVVINVSWNVTPYNWRKFTDVSEESTVSFGVEVSCLLFASC
jgi:hypothetical protein